MHVCRRAVRAFLLVGLWALAAAAWAQRAVALGPSRLEFASPDEARVELSRDDDWVAAVGPIQRAFVLGSPGPVTREAFRAGLSGMAREWSPAEAERWRAAAQTLAPRLQALGVTLPPVIRLVLIDPANPANLPHTRGDAIFLPQGIAIRQVTEAELLAHELFHVLSRRTPALRDRIYALLGFTPVAELEWPAAWDDVRLANPDAPRHQHAMQIEVAGESVRVMPVLVARRASLQPGEHLFQIMDVRLLVLAPAEAGQPSRAEMRDGQPRWLPAFQTEAYLRRLGGNTRYVIHPEETAADNFTYLTSGRPVPNPGLLRQLESVLRDAHPTEGKP